MELRLEAPRALAWCWALWSLALALGIWWGCDLGAGQRLALVAAVAVVGWRGCAHLRCSGGPRRLRWESDGRWRLEFAPGRMIYVQPAPLRRLGAMIWIRWREGPGGQYFHADGIVVEPKALPALKARTHFAGPSRQRSTP